MSKTETATLAETLTRAGVTLTATATRTAQDTIDTWIDDEESVSATDILDQVADVMFYTDYDRADALWNRVQAGEFDGWPPIWTAA